AARRVGELNATKALGHDDWQIPTLEQLKILYQNQKAGALKGSFKTAASSGSDCPFWYWSSTEHRDSSSCVHAVRFSDGGENWHHKDYFRLSCRPVRLMPVS